MTDLILEAGKYYKTRDGRKAFVAGINPFGDRYDDDKAVGFINGNGTCSWSTNGTWMERADEDDFDLVAEWQEPMVLWIVTDGECCRTLRTEESARKWVATSVNPDRWRIVKMVEINDE
jgi:hypothetical protein